MMKQINTKNLDALCESNEALIINKALLNKDGDLSSAMVTLCKAVIRWIESDMHPKASHSLRNSMLKYVANLGFGKMVEKNGWTGVTCPAYLQNAILKRDLPLCVKAVITCCDQVGMDEIEELSNHLMNQIAKVACGFVARDARFLIG